MTDTTNNSNLDRPSVVFQGEPGAYSHLACLEALPDFEPLPCLDFATAFKQLSSGGAERGMIPIENSLAGRVADVHHLLPGSGLFIVGEHFQSVNHHLMAIEGASLEGLKEVHSHVHALPQCREVIRELGLRPVVHADTAGAARMVAESKDSTIAAISSELAAQIYGLNILRKNVQDISENVTRFLMMSREPITPALDSGDCITSFIFAVRSVPAALYKALGGFATNGVNITKLESYMEGGSFEQAQFYADIEGHPDTRSAQLAFEELQFYCTRFEILGTYHKSSYRKLQAK